MIRKTIRPHLNPPLRGEEVNDLEIKGSSVSIENQALETDLTPNYCITVPVLIIPVRIIKVIM